MAETIGSPEERIWAAMSRPCWLGREHVHPLGRNVNADQLVEKTTGRP